MSMIFNVGFILKLGHAPKEMGNTPKKPRASSTLAIDLGGSKGVKVRLISSPAPFEL
jgi:hypothetical protein